MNMFNLYEYALQRAQDSARRRELPVVASGSGVDYSWLGKFARGQIPGADYYMQRERPKARSSRARAQA
jgi:hypothetical protein